MTHIHLTIFRFLRSLAPLRLGAVRVSLLFIFFSIILSKTEDRVLPIYTFPFYHAVYTPTMSLRQFLPTAF